MPEKVVRIYKKSPLFIYYGSFLAKLIKKSLYEGCEYPEGKIFEDIYMSHKLISKCKRIVYTNKNHVLLLSVAGKYSRKKLYIESLIIWRI